MSNYLYDALFAPHVGNQAPFISDPISHSEVSYDSFLKKIAQCANVLKDAGMQPGDRLAAQIGKSVSALVLYAACIRSGIIYLPLNTSYTLNEIEYFILDSGASLFVCDPESLGELSRIQTKNKLIYMTQSADGLSGSLPMAWQAASEVFKTVDRNPEDLAAFLYTSGTTGRSKGAMLTQDNLLSNCKELTEYWQFSKKDILLHALPVFHTHGLFVATNICLFAGASMIFESKFDIDRMIQLIPSSTTMMGVPTFYTRLLSDDRFDKSLTQNMRLFISGSAPLLAETHMQFETRTGHRILERYGMTETNMNTSNPYEGERRPGSVGFPLPNIELKITDMETGEELPPGEIGIIEVRGPNVFKGYWNMPEKTAEELRPDGFFITGDLGVIDNDGYVSIVGRNKDLIISGGYNIYPKEIEALLDKQPGVIESAVIGLPDADFGEAVIAILVVEKDNINLISVESAVKDSLARFKHPRQLLIIDELPRNTMGKVQKNILREQYKDSFHAA